MYLPDVLLGAGTVGVCAETELYDQHSVVVGIYGILSKDVVNGVKEVSVASEEVDFRIVVVRIGAAERGGIVVSTCCIFTQSEVAVGIYGELGVVFSNKREGESNILY